MKTCKLLRDCSNCLFSDPNIALGQACKDCKRDEKRIRILRYGVGCGYPFSDGTSLRPRNISYKNSANVFGL